MAEDLTQACETRRQKRNRLKRWARLHACGRRCDRKWAKGRPCTFAQALAALEYRGVRR